MVEQKMFTLTFLWLSQLMHQSLVFANVGVNSMVILLCNKCNLLPCHMVFYTNFDWHVVNTGWLPLQ